VSLTGARLLHQLLPRTATPKRVRGSTDRRRRGSTENKKPLQINDLQRLFGYLAEWTGLEPATPGVTGRYSNQLNYHSW
jgi:hypothetical protein